MSTGTRRRFLLIGALTVALGCDTTLRPRTPGAATLGAAPPFELMDHRGQAVALTDLTARGVAVVVFYRGHW